MGMRRGIRASTGGIGEGIQEDGTGDGVQDGKKRDREQAPGNRVDVLEGGPVVEKRRNG